jgi:hypothetical protein
MNSTVFLKRMACAITILMVAVACASVTTSTNKTSIQRYESFDNDSGWDGRNNRLTALGPTIIRQHFGWSATNYSSGKSGEIGGVVWRSVRPAYYGKKIETKTLDDRLECSGAFSISQITAINQWHTGSCIWIGFFNSDEQGWRPVNQIGFRLLGHRDYEFSTYAGIPVGAMVEPHYGPASYAAGGAFIKKTEGLHEANMREMKQDDILRILPDGQRHTWKMTYDPDGNNGNGEMEFSIDGGKPIPVGIRDNHRKSGATFNRFGIFNEQIPGYQMTAFFDDITINGEPQDFSTDPGWEGVGNMDEFIDREQYGANDFGYSETNFAGGKNPGEIGGLLWQVHADQSEIKAFYGGDAGSLTLDDKLTARGKIAFPTFGIDSGMQFGWFNTEEQGWPTKNFIGAYLDSYSNVGRFIAAQYGPSSGEGDTGPCEILFRPTGQVYDWELMYDPKDGNGAVTLTFNGETQTIALTKEARASGASLNRFGFFNVQGNNGKHTRVYFDYIEYTRSK